MKKNVLFSLLLVIALILTACTRNTAGTVTTEPAGAGSEAPEAATEAVVTEPAATEPPAGTGSLPPDPQEIAFQASDGQALSGLYYPAASSPAPLVVLMHWVAGNMTDWNEVAPWLQNRGLANPYPNPGEQPWWEPAWFPSMPAGASYGVFIFSFRGCLPMDQQGCSQIDEAGWLLDSQAAAAMAVTLDGVDPTRIAFIGSSIGADGAIDGCAWLAENQPGACQGALSLSPGSYLTLPYPQAVQTLGAAQSPVPAWCLADEAEIGICNAAAAGNDSFRAVEIPGGQHGNMLLRPDLDPLPMQLILDFLSETVGP